MQVLIIFCTCPNRDSANEIAHRLVEAKLAACVNILPGVTSVYSWQGQLESAEEQLLLIKSSALDYTAVEQAIRSLHPYELPEIIAAPISHGLPDYLNWIHSCRS